MSRSSQSGLNCHPKLSRVIVDETDRLKEDEVYCRFLDDRTRHRSIISASSSGAGLILYFAHLSMLQMFRVHACMPVHTLLQKACILGYRAISCVAGSSDTSCTTLSFWQTQ